MYRLDEVRNQSRESCSLPEKVVAGDKMVSPREINTPIS